MVFKFRRAGIVVLFIAAPAVPTTAYDTCGFSVLRFGVITGFVIVFI